MDIPKGNILTKDLPEGWLRDFCELLEAQQIERLHNDHLDCPTNIENCRVSIHQGRKYINVDIGYSGKYMVEIATNNIYGIKAYGVIHRGHCYGNLSTVNLWYWGDYSAQRKTG